jgi:hypothetical protein
MSHVHKYNQMAEHKAAGWQTPIWNDYAKIVAEAESLASVELVEVRELKEPRHWLIN